MLCFEGFFIPGFPKLKRFQEHHERVLKQFLPKIRKHLVRYRLCCVFNAVTETSGNVYLDLDFLSTIDITDFCQYNVIISAWWLYEMHLSDNYILIHYLFIV